MTARRKRKSERPSEGKHVTKKLVTRNKQYIVVIAANLEKRIIDWFSEEDGSRVFPQFPRLFSEADV